MGNALTSGLDDPAGSPLLNASALLFSKNPGATIAGYSSLPALRAENAQKVSQLKAFNDILPTLDPQIANLVKAVGPEALPGILNRQVMSSYVNNIPGLNDSQRAALMAGGEKAMDAFAQTQFLKPKDKYEGNADTGVVDLTAPGGPKVALTGTPRAITGYENGYTQPFLLTPGGGPPVAFGGPGPMANPPLSDAFKTIVDAQRFGAPGAIPLPPPTIGTSPGQGVIPAPSPRPVQAPPVSQAGAPGVMGAGTPSAADIARAALATAAQTPAERAAAEAKAKIEAEQTANRPKEAATAAGSLMQHLQDLERLRDMATQLMAHPGLNGITGAQGQFPNIPGSDASNAEALLNSLGGNALTDVYNSARQLSTTGGGFGRLTETEIPIFKGIYASLDKKQSPSAFKANLQHIIDYANQSAANLKGTYKQEFNRDYTPPAPQTSQTAAASLDAARAAIAKGADKAKVIQRLQNAGIDASSLK